MTKRKVIRKSNKAVHLYSLGGQSKEVFNKAFESGNLGGTLGAVGSSVGTIFNSSMQNAQIGDTSSIENKIKQTGNVYSNTNDDLMNEWSSNTPLENVSWKDIRGGSTEQRVGNLLTSAASGAASGATIGGSIGAMVGGVVGLGSSLAGWIAGDKKAKRQAEELNRQADAANREKMAGLVNRADSIDTQNDLNTIFNYSAFGGPIDLLEYDSPLNTFAKGGGIHIKPQNKGKFTSYCGGNVTAECIAKGKRSSDPAVRKRATFAANARKWKHAEGGFLDEPEKRIVPTEEVWEEDAPLTESPLMTVGNGKYTPTGNVEDVNGIQQEAKEFYKNWYSNPKRIDILSKNIEDTNYPTLFEGKTGNMLFGDIYNPSSLNYSAEKAAKNYIDNVASVKINPYGDRFTYNKDNHMVNVIGDYEGDRAIFHEIPHAANATALEETVGKILFDAGYNDPYDDSGKEGYAKLMDTRANFNIDPNKDVTIEDIERMKKDKNTSQDFLHRYDNDTLLKLFNDVAMQNSDTEDYNYAAFGGQLSTNGADFTNGVTIIDNGGTHEENPMEGVQLGVDSQGIPNLVEEGEVIYNDYVFSNRLMADSKLLESVNLPKSYDNHSFAAIAEKISKESEERPNDPISQRGLADSMMKLQQAQEIIRQKEQASQEGRKYACGGKRGKLYSGTGPYTNFLDFTDNENDTDKAFVGYTKNGILMDDGSIATYNSPEYEDAVYALAESAGSPTTIKGEESGRNRNRNGAWWLRYAPVAGNTLGLLHSIFDKPDYTNADAISDAANRAADYTPVRFNPVGNYLSYNPFDRNYYTNKLNAQAGATRRAIMNTTNPSRNAALLAADYNTQNALGNLYRQAEEYNLAQRQQVEAFNRATNMANAEMGLKADIANQEAALKAGNIRLNGIAQAMAMKNAIDASREASISANTSGLFESLGNIGTEAYNRNMILSNPALYYSVGKNGKVTYKNGYDNLSEAEKAQVRKEASKEAKKRGKANGGYLTIKKGGKHG